MKQINAEYERAFNCFKNVHETAEDNTKTYTSSTDSTETAAEFMEIINGLIHCEGLEIDVIGSWVWVTGNTYPHRETLKNAGFKWASKKQAWYYRPDSEKTTRHSGN